MQNRTVCGFRCVEQVVGQAIGASRIGGGQLVNLTGLRCPEHGRSFVLRAQDWRRQLTVFGLPDETFDLRYESEADASIAVAWVDKNPHGGPFEPGQRLLFLLRELFGVYLCWVEATGGSVRFHWPGWAAGTEPPPLPPTPRLTYDELRRLAEPLERRAREFRASKGRWPRTEDELQTWFETSGITRLPDGTRVSYHKEKRRLSYRARAGDGVLTLPDGRQVSLELKAGTQDIERPLIQPVEGLATGYNGVLTIRTPRDGQHPKFNTASAADVERRLEANGAHQVWLPDSDEWF